MNFKFPFIIKWVLSRIFFIYLLIFLAASYLVDLREVKYDIGLSTLNRFRPESFDYFTNFIHGKETLKKEELKRFAFYFKKITDYLPKQSDAFGLRGYCAYHLGQFDQSIYFYKEAIKVSPTFFWFYHNLGLIYFKQRDYKHSAEVLRKAIAQNPDEAIFFIVSSERLYLPLQTENPTEVKQNLIDKIREGYYHSFILLLQSYDYLKDYTNMVAVATSATQANLGDNSDFFYYIGLGAYKLEEYQKAVQYLQYCIKLDPNHLEAHKLLKSVMQKIGREDIVDAINQNIETIFSQINSSIPSIIDMKLGAF